MKYEEVEENAQDKLARRIKQETSTTKLRVVAREEVAEDL